MTATVAGKNGAWWAVDEDTEERLVGPFMTEGQAVQEAIRLNGTDHCLPLEQFLGTFGGGR